MMYRGVQFYINSINTIQHNSIHASHRSIQFNSTPKTELIELCDALGLHGLIEWLSDPYERAGQQISNEIGRGKHIYTCN